MTAEIFTSLTYGMMAMAVVVFICLYFVTAGYGQFCTRSWGWSINNKVAWMLMEAPVFIVMLLIWLNSDSRSGGTTLKWHLPQLVLFCLFELHYFQRSFVFPWLIKGKSRMPIALVLVHSKAARQILFSLPIPVTPCIFDCGAWLSVF